MLKTYRLELHVKIMQHWDFLGCRVLFIDFATELFKSLIGSGIMQPQKSWNQYSILKEKCQVFKTELFSEMIILHASGKISSVSNVK